jgi:flagellar biosynthesis/type III secretory pathway chaperone
MTDEGIAQSNIYESGPEGKKEFEKEFFKGTFDGTNYDKKMKTISDQFDKYNSTGLENPYRKPPAVEETLETGTGNGNGGATGDGVKKLSDEEKMKANQELFAKMLDKKGARIEDASNMALSFAGKAFKPEATVKTAFGEFFEEESKRPSSTRKIDQSAAALAINDYIAGKRSAEQTETLLAKLKLSGKTLGDRYSEKRRNGETNKLKAFAQALYDDTKGTKILKEVSKIPETIDDVKELGLNNGDIIGIAGEKGTSILEVIISPNGTVSTETFYSNI